MENPYKNIKDNISYSRGGITSKVIVKSEKSNATLFCMAAGTDMSEHTSTKEGIVYVLEGKGTFTLKGKPIEMKSGVIIEMEKDTVHSLSAKKDTSFLLVLHS